ncbi:hypothetical protein COT48_03470 [Candidatus Woesearchaeota archaeon CG08_land_8_20_14_0_20_47_9]|nr:MAG: hypothetical protein AUJ69_02760 [Candidatus Woesearchaeota archaeon CG1_02_47_18]PIO03772.1 MAG: hypothetical protein COT48_03470 [Candidatus Woesearchaeota archaeon CG08_land_8_20_14_0_20_47_9]HII30155.1 hypothetical protein [Candidatus Woesearchaeota archaeon]
MKLGPEKRHLGLSNKALFSIIVGFLMVSSVLGYVFIGRSDSTEQYDYNGFKFERTGSGLQTEVDGMVVYFDSLPQQAEGIAVDSAAVDKIRNTRMFYITSNSTSKSKEAIAKSGFDISKAVALKGVYAQAAFIDPTKYSIPVVSCSNATPFVPVLTFDRANETSVRAEGNCIFIGAPSDSEFIRAKDALLYRFLGILTN